MYNILSLYIIILTQLALQSVAAALRMLEENIYIIISMHHNILLLLLWYIIIIIFNNKSILHLYIIILTQLALQSVAAALRMLEAESEVQPTFQEELFCSLVAIRRFLGINLLATSIAILRF